MFRSIFDHPQGDIFIFFTSVTKDKIMWFVVACLVVYLLCFVLMLLCALPSLVVAVPLLHYKYNRHATTNQIILSLVTEIKENISLRMVKD